MGHVITVGDVVLWGAFIAGVGLFVLGALALGVEQGWWD
jgi:hypothetical protein